MRWTTKWLGVVVGSTWSACASIALVQLSSLGLAPEVAFAGDGSTVYVQRVTDICHLPRPGNNGHVLGHDVGWSLRDGATTYWFFGDTFVDANGSGVALDGPGEFVTGTIARSEDVDPTNCVDLTYRVSAAGLAIPAVKLQGQRECLTWPTGGVVVNGTVYFYFTSVRNDACRDDAPPAPDGDPANTFAGGLAKIANKTTLKSKRVGILWAENAGYFGTPVQSGGFVYVFSVRRGAGSDSAVLIGRVAEAQIEHIAEYRYWDGGAWVPSATAAAPIFTETIDRIDLLGPMSIAYNAFLDRWVAVSSCGYYGTRICVRTTIQKGASAAALTSGWNPASELFDCAGVAADCYQGAQHAALANGNKIYVTNARFDGKPWARPQHYWVTLREIEIGTDPAPFSREHTTSEDSFAFDKTWIDQGLMSEQGRDGWTYVSWPDRTPLLWNANLKAWWGGELVGAEPAPLVAADTMRPSFTKHVARVWTAPAAATVTIDGEAWLEQSCGDGARVEVLKVSGATQTSLWLKNLEPTWTENRGRRVNLPPQQVAAGDEIVFRVGTRTGDATCDTVFWNPSLTVDYANAVVRDAYDDYRDDVTQGFRQWRYETCAYDAGTGVVSGCVDMSLFKPTTAGGYWFGDVFGLVVRDALRPPFSAHVTSRTWTAPRAGRIRLVGHVVDLEPSSGSGCGAQDDGSRFAMYLGAQKVWPTGSGWAEMSNAQFDLALDRVVAAGTTLRFLASAGPGTNGACDLTGLEAHFDFTWE
ncbi:MAG: DUF4185 domain-containing protein [bacterium]